MRMVARRYGLIVSCSSAILNRQPIWQVNMRKVLNRIPESQRRAVMNWLTREGPFWNARRMHPESEWFECGESVVTDTGIGEAAFRKTRGIATGVLSFSPSDWQYSPIQFLWRRSENESDTVSGSVENWCNASDLELALRQVAPRIRSWKKLQDIAILRYSKLTFSETCFDGLIGVPFVKRSADQILSLLDVLDRLATGFDHHGRWTVEARKTYQDYFTGDRAWFSDSSDTEKRKFRRALTFRDPTDPNSEVICGWHGKERHSMLRLHFSWPIRQSIPVSIVYVGPKLTKK